MRVPVFTYAIDEQDRLVSASDGYFDFAGSNDWLGAEASIGLPLWDFVAGDSMRKVQQLLIRRVRSDGRPVKLPFRCDSPDLRREMLMRIEPRETDHVLFSAFLISETPRAHQPLADPSAPRGEELVEMCGWCDRFLVDGEWLEVEDAAARLGLTTGSNLPAISHGICPRCSRLLLGA